MEMLTGGRRKAEGAAGEFWLKKDRNVFAHHDVVTGPASMI